jgi:hypothetical protein
MRMMFKRWRRRTVAGLVPLVTLVLSQAKKIYLVDDIPKYVHCV